MLLYCCPYKDHYYISKKENKFVSNFEGNIYIYMKRKCWIKTNFRQIGFDSKLYIQSL